MSREIVTINSGIGLAIGEAWSSLQVDTTYDEMSVGGQSVRELERIEALEAALLHSPESKIETFHEFLDGLYVRGIHVVKDTVIVGHMHRHECLNIMERGKVLTIVNGEARLFEAGYFGKTGAMTRKASVVVEDMTWVTVHSNPDNERNLAIIEEHLFIKSPTFLAHDSRRTV